MPSQDTKNTLGIIAGGGNMPFLIADAGLAQGRNVHVIGIDGEASEKISTYSHDWMKWGELGHLLKILEQQHCKEIVIIGSVTRPDLSQVKFDFGAVKNMPFLMSLTIGGDDTILSGIVKFFEKHGFSVKGAHEIAPGLLAGVGVLGKYRPSIRDEQDIETGLNVVRTLGKLDVGQAAVISRDYVLAVEAAEGTDSMLRRCSDLRQWGEQGKKKRTGVLVKCPKPTQEQRIDMPTVGSRTVELASEAGLAGIAISAGGVLLADKERMVEIADSQKMFLIGVDSSSERV